MKNLLTLSCAVLSIVSACGDASTNPAPTTSAVARATCNYDFEATVRSGPATGTSVHGALIIGRTSTERFAGELRPRDGSAPLQVGGMLSNGALSLQVRLADGRTLNGSGTYAGAFESCQMNLTGDLTGPTAADRGDWLGIRRTCQRNCNACLDNACQSTCESPTGGQLVPGGSCVGLLCPTNCVVCQISSGFTGSCMGPCDCP